MKCYFTCAYSDYHPIGHGLFGSMMCFKDNKKAYLSVTDKAGFLEIADSMSGMVQETHVCPDFERRKAGTGYRG